MRRSTLMLLTAILSATLSPAWATTVHHIVLFTFKPGISAAQIDEFITVGEALLEDIEGVLSLSIDRQARSDRPVHITDYDVALYAQWQDQAVADHYADHILHRAFIQLYQPAIEKIQVIDFYGNPNHGAPAAGGLPSSETTLCERVQ